MRLLTLSLLLCLAPWQSAASQNQHKAYSGVWQGTLGPDKVTVCFDRGLWGNSYRHQQTPVLTHLQPEKSSDTATEVRWIEYPGDGTPKVWVLQQLTAEGTTAGYWLDSATQEQHPIKLTRTHAVNDEDFEQRNCSDDAYIKPLETYDLSLTTGDAKEFAPGKRYRELLFADWQSIELLLDAPGITQINAHYALKTDRDAQEQYYEARRRLLHSYAFGTLVYGEQYIEPVFWSEDFIVIRSYLWPSGLGARGINITSKVWDLQTGQEINLWNWLTGSKPDEYGSYKLPAALRQYLIRHHGMTSQNTAKTHPDDDCEPHAELDFSLTLNWSGISFSPSAWSPACRDPYPVSFVELQPFFSEQGKAAIARMKAAGDLLLPDLKLLEKQYEQNSAPASIVFLRQVQQELPLKRSNVTLYNNIAYHLDRHGHYEAAVFLLEGIVKSFKDRTVAYINLGDAYWALEQKEPAQTAYAEYIRLMRHNGRAARIPERVFTRMELERDSVINQASYLKVTEAQLRAAVADGTFAVKHEGKSYTFGKSDYMIDTSQVTDMSRLFLFADADDEGFSASSKVGERPGLEDVLENFNEDIGHWNVSNVTNMEKMFLGAIKFNQDISRWDVSNVTNMEGMFQHAVCFNQDIGRWNVSNVTNMRAMFFSWRVNIGGWGTKHESSEIAALAKRFNGCTVTESKSGSLYFVSSFNQDISNWDVSKVTDMHAMLQGAVSFNQNISQWNVSAVENMHRMFFEATSFNQDISPWDVSKVNNMNGMFWRAVNFNQDISRWNVSAVKNMHQMFFEATSFNQDLSPWQTPEIAEKPNAFIRENYPAEWLPQWGKPDSVANAKKD